MNVIKKGFNENLSNQRNVQLKWINYNIYCLERRVKSILNSDWKTPKLFNIDQLKTLKHIWDS